VKSGRAGVLQESARQRRHGEAWRKVIAQESKKKVSYKNGQPPAGMRSAVRFFDAFVSLLCETQPENKI